MTVRVELRYALAEARAGSEFGEYPVLDLDEALEKAKEMLEGEYGGNIKGKRR